MRQYLFVFLLLFINLAQASQSNPENPFKNLDGKSIDEIASILNQHPELACADMDNQEKCTNSWPSYVENAVHYVKNGSAFILKNSSTANVLYFLIVYQSVMAETVNGTMINGTCFCNFPSLESPWYNNPYLVSLAIVIGIPGSIGSIIGGITSARTIYSLIRNAFCPTKNMKKAQSLEGQIAALKKENEILKQAIIVGENAVNTTVDYDGWLTKARELYEKSWKKFRKHTQKITSKDPEDIGDDSN